MVVPVSMPDFLWSSAEFRPIKPMQIARSEGRETASIEAYARYWIAAYTITPATSQEAWRLERFLSARAPFIAVHPKKCRPFAYPGGPLSGTKAAGGAFDGSAIINDLTNRAAPVISGLPAEFVFTEGDIIEFRETNTNRTLHMVETDTTGGLDGIATVPLDYPVPLEFTGAATVHLERPGCVMQIVGDTRSLRPTVSSSLSFEAEEVFLP